MELHLEYGFQMSQGCCVFCLPGPKGYKRLRPSFTFLSMLDIRIHLKLDYSGLQKLSLWLYMICTIILELIAHAWCSFKSQCRSDSVREGSEY